MLALPGGPCSVSAKGLVQSGKGTHFGLKPICEEGQGDAPIPPTRASSLTGEGFKQPLQGDWVGTHRGQHARDPIIIILGSEGGEPGGSTVFTSHGS